MWWPCIVSFGLVEGIKGGYRNYNCTTAGCYLSTYNRLRPSEPFAGSDDEYSDDDDMSWKVRRAAAKCLDAVVSTRHEMLPEFYRTVSPALIARFKEREENVKADVFHAYLSLLKQTRPAQSWLCDPDAMEQGETPLTMLQSQVEHTLSLSLGIYCAYTG